MISIKTTKALIISALVLLAGHLSAQNTDDGSSAIAESWTGIGVNYKPNKNLTLGLEEQLRLKSQDKLYNNSFTELSASYKLISGLKAGIGYRYINSYDDQGNIQGPETHHRLHYRLAYKTGINDLDLGLRLQYQTRKEQSVEDLAARKRWRVRTDMEYNIGNWKLDPKMSVELLYDLDDNPDDRVNKYRLSIGSTYKINKSMDIDFRYMYENGLGSSLEVVPHVLRINFTYTIKRKKKKVDETELKLENDSGSSN